MNKEVFVGATRELIALAEGPQANRLLRLDFPREDGPGGVLMLANRLVAREGLSKDFRFEAEVLSDNAHIPLKQVLGKMVTISLVREDGTLRYFNGYVTEFRLVKTDGGFAWFRMVLEPWLAFSRLRKDSVVFQEKSVVEITEAIFEHYEHRDWKTRLFNAYPPLSCAIQYNETDHNHLNRRWEDCGLYYWYEHRADGHTLWIGDNTEMAESIDPCGNLFVPDEIPFRRHSGSMEDDGIHEWQAVRQLGSGSTTLGSFDYKNPHPQNVTRESLNRQGVVASYEVFESTGAYGFKDLDGGDVLARHRMEEHDARAQHFEAKGNDRAVQPGRSFTLGGHFSAAPRVVPVGESPASNIADREYVILSVVHTATNNYQDGRSIQSQYECSFTCLRKSVPWRPGRGFNSSATTIPGVQTAIVVGPSGQDIYTDEYARVKVQFHWDRKGKSDAGSSAWVRVASACAGNERGLMAVPRIGEEVVLQYLDGDPDRPIITGRVYNRANPPPWQLGGQEALTGLRSRELTPGGGNAAGGRSNHLILDDTNGQIQAQLRSDHLDSQLSLGYVTRIEDTAGRTDARGEGWELRTDGHGAVRAAEGMLITTERRTRAQSHIKDMDETLQRLSAAHRLHDEQAGTAVQYQVQEIGQQDAVADVLKGQHDAIRGSGSKFPELSAPHLVLASPAGIESTTAQSTHIASDQHTALTTGRNLSVATGDSLFASVKQTFRLFVHKAGMKLIAAAGKVTIEARDDEVELIAKKVLTLISQTDWIDLKGKKGIRLHGAGSMLEISDTVQFFTSRPVLFHGNLATLGPKNRPHPSSEYKIAPADPANPDITKKQLMFTLQAHPASGRPLANFPYTLYKGETKVKVGITDDLGRIAIEHEQGTPAYSITLPTGERFEMQVVSKFAPTDDPQHIEQTLSNQGLRALDGSSDSRMFTQPSSD